MERKSQGFTLIELMVTLAVAGILLAIAAPNYQQFVLDARMTAQADEFLTMLNFARSEAIKRGARVTLCKSNNGAGCVTTGGWGQGWLVFADGGTTGTGEGTDTILRVHGVLELGSALVGNTAVANVVTYRPDGQSQQAGIFTLCGSIAANPGRTISLSLGTASVGPTTCP